MFRVQVSSTNLLSVGYDAVSRVLEIEFRKGALYAYQDVPESAHAGLMGAASKGGYFDDFIKPRYRFQRLR